LEGRKLNKALNGKYLKKYYPSVWQGTWCSIKFMAGKMVYRANNCKGRKVSDVVVQRQRPVWL
jgi:hypothetical protein